MEELYTAEFPDHVVVTAAPTRDPGKKVKPQTRKILEPPVVLEGLPHVKAMKYARNNGATIKDADGEVVSAPEVTVTDNRAKSAAASQREQASQISDLQETVAKLEKALESKQEKRGPKPGSKNA